jgi:hypothetical protein
MTTTFHSAASIRFIGDELDPDEISSLLNCKPTRSHRKGDLLRDKTGEPRVNSETGLPIAQRTGCWMLEIENRMPADLNGQIIDILKMLPSDDRLWRGLAKGFKIDFFCGLFMESGNEGLEIAPETLFEMGKRGIKLGLDIYGPESGIENSTTL